MRVAVTGGAGFIGSHFVDKCVEEGWDVRIVDNFRTGRMEFIDINLDFAMNLDFAFDALDIVTCPMSDLYRAFDGCDWVAHFAANADVRYGLQRPYFDIEQNIIGTHRVLEAMRGVGCRQIFFASTASIYGSLRMEKIPETAPMAPMNSLYGTSKLAGEGLISSYVDGFGFNAVIGRWVQIMGERYLHGHIIDFVRKLKRNQNYLKILGSGYQKKSGLYVKDLARGIYDAISYHEDDQAFSVYNLGTDSTFTVIESADIICDLMGLRNVEYVPQDPSFTNAPVGGWIGDNPEVLLNNGKARAYLAWEPTVTVPEAIEITVRWLLSEECTYL